MRVADDAARRLNIAADIGVAVSSIVSLFIPPSLLRNPTVVGVVRPDADDML